MKGNALQLFRNILYTPLQTVCKLNNNGVLRSTSFIQNSKIYQEKYTPITYSRKELHSSSTLNENTGRHRIILGETKGITSTKLRGPMIDESDNITENLGALEAASLAAEANEDLAQELESKDNFQLYPDETTGDTLFNGVKYVYEYSAKLECRGEGGFFYSLNVQKITYIFSYMFLKF